VTIAEPSTPTIDGIDHVVLTVSDMERAVDFYVQTLDMTPVTFYDGRRALTFGRQKFNLHHVGHELSPFEGRPIVGSADLCFLTSMPIDQVLAHLERRRPCGGGPVERTGAVSRLRSVYLRDPDGNLVEVANQLDQPCRNGRSRVCGPRVVRAAQRTRR
jgi:catechol 2,3-dioxygenase-like lactoylglutathione lyase family enzyme